MFTIYQTDCDGNKGPKVKCATLAEAMGHLEEALEDNQNFPMYRDEVEGLRYTLIFDIDGAHELINLLPRPSGAASTVTADSPDP